MSLLSRLVVRPLAFPRNSFPSVLPRSAVVRRVVSAGAVVVTFALVMMGHVETSRLQVVSAQAQEHHHPAADVELHEKFYSTWMMPDHPYRSCCNNQDCYPTEVRFRDGFWEARRREDGHYIRVPWEKIEQRRDNPDGRNHVCMPPPGRGYPDTEIFCFALGSGI